MADALLWDLEETAHQLGNVSARTVLRMIARGEIATKKVGRRRMVISQSVRDWLEGDIRPAHTGECVGRDVRGVNVCRKHANERMTASTAELIHRTGGPATSMRVARELADLLAPETNRRQKQYSPNGESKRESKNTGAASLKDCSRR